MAIIVRNRKAFEDFLSGLVEIHLKTTEADELIRSNIVATFEHIDGQIAQLKKRSKKGGNKFKVPAPSLETIREEKAKNTKATDGNVSPSTSGSQNNTGRPKRAAAAKVEEANKVVSKRTKRKLVKRKSSSSPIGRPVTKNRREEPQLSEIKPVAGEKENSHPTPTERPRSGVSDSKANKTVSVRGSPLKESSLSSNKDQKKDCTYSKDKLDVPVSEPIQTPPEAANKTKIIEREKTIVVSPDPRLKENAEVQKASSPRKSPTVSTIQAKVSKESVECFKGFSPLPDRNADLPEVVPVPTNEQPSLKRPHSDVNVISSSEDEASPVRNTSQSKVPKKNSPKNATLKIASPQKATDDVRTEAVLEAKGTVDEGKISPEGESEKTSPDTLRPPEMLPPKRITRSKMAKPKENLDPQPRNQSPSSEDLSSPEKRCTRSKMAKPKPNSDSDSGRGDPSSEESSSAEKRCTRSKMAKAPKQMAVTDSGKSGDDSPDTKSGSSSQEGRTLVKQKINVKCIKDIFSPGMIKEQEKENQMSGIYKSLQKKPGERFTPLQVRNAYVTPAKSSKIPLVSSALKSRTALEDAERRKKEEEALKKRQKEDEAIRKKQEMVKAKQEEMRRKNEEKKMKCAAIREAVEKEKSELQVRLEKEREERERAAREQLEKKKEEEVLKKKMAHQTKALEAESRRLKEEAARQAKIKEMEEEQRQQEELRLKQQEETERIHKQRLEEMRLKEAALKARELQKKKVNVPVKDKDNYDINDLLEEDDDDSEVESTNPKKDIPLWARKGEERERQDKIHALMDMDVIRAYYACPSKTPDLTELFGKMTMKRVRTSSAVWLDTPPLRK